MCSLQEYRQKALAIARADAEKGDITRLSVGGGRVRDMGAL